MEIGVISKCVFGKKEMRVWTRIRCLRIGSSGVVRVHEMQGVHVKCIPFYCNVVHELKGAGMEHISVGHIFVFKICLT
jgi:hypothetical protein